MSSAADTEPRQQALAFCEADELGPEEISGLSADLGLDPKRERLWLNRMLGLATAAARHDSKIHRLLALVRRAREPVVVFTEFRDSLDAIRRQCPIGLAVACLHGGQTTVERRLELGRFRRGDTSVLLATDVAGIGLNLQMRARLVVNVELPWNPIRLEQRAGRIDRFGQTRRVHVALFVTNHRAESIVILRLAQRALAAERATGDAPIDLGVTAASLRAGVWTGDAPAESSPSGPAIWLPTKRWSRPARAAARMLDRQRMFRGRWRVQDADGGRACWTFARSSLFDRSRSGAVLVFDVPIVDGAGGVVESHVVPVLAPGKTPRDALTSSIVEVARERARAALLPRCRRLSRRLRQRRDRDVGRERELQRWLTTRLQPGEAQPGLFDRREWRAWQTRAEVVEDVARAIEARVADLKCESAIEVGRPSLMVTFVAAR